MELGPKLLMSTDNTPVLESTNGRVPVVDDSQALNLSADECDSIYDISACADWISQRGFRSAALQFPDDMLRHSTRVSDLLERRIGYKPFILADTSYGSCCVDEVAAQHFNAECILHFGDACMSASEGRIPVKYVFPKLPFDEQDFRTKISLASEIGCAADSRIVLIIDICAGHVAQQITDAVADSIAEPCHVVNLSQCSAGGTSLAADCGTAIFVGETRNSPRLTLLMMSNPGKIFISYDIRTKVLQKEDVAVNRMLRKRLYLIEKAKDANIVGIVVGALSVGGYLQVVDRMKSLCRAAGKKFVVLSIGKINVAKLSNFADAVDIYVWISCPFNIMLETSDYPHPILTPFEMEVACNARKCWYADSGWITDFRFLLKGDTEPEEATEHAGSDSETDVSLITGRLRRLPCKEDKAEASGSLVPRSEALQLQTVSVETRFAEKTWKGLEENLGKTEVKEVREGRSGIASGYANEAQSSQSGAK